VALARTFLAGMRANGWVGDLVDVVRMRDGNLTTVDNPRISPQLLMSLSYASSPLGDEDIYPGAG
jgi:hypothetical protein